MFVIQRKIDKMFLYGRKHFTPSFTAARRFHTEAEARGWLEQWFDVTDFKIFRSDRVL